MNSQATKTFEFTDIESVEASGYGRITSTPQRGASRRPDRDPLTVSTDLKAPTFTAAENWYSAVASRRAGRLNAANISTKEYDELLSERQTLLDHFFNQSITRRQELRLQYVRWSLDRIEDAKYGSDLDVIEDVVRTYEKFAQEVNSLKLQLDSKVSSRR